MTVASESSSSLRQGTTALVRGVGRSKLNDTRVASEPDFALFAREGEGSLRLSERRKMGLRSWRDVVILTQPKRYFDDG